MNSTLIKFDDENYFLSISVSIIFHALIILIAVFIFNIAFSKSHQTNSYVQVFMNEFESIARTKVVAEDKASNSFSNIKEKVNEEVKPIKRKIIEQKENLSKDNPITFLNFSESNADTANLDQIYREATLNLSVRYPKGWTYVDQNVNDQLDGVTFWSMKGNYDPPPYIHIDVKEKYLFNKNRFKNKRLEKNYVIYYNDPVELAGQISQILYIRTDDETDFSIKLIMNDYDSFKSFQPEFFGMIKTFKFGKQYF